MSSREGGIHARGVKHDGVVCQWIVQCVSYHWSLPLTLLDHIIISFLFLLSFLLIIVRLLIFVLVVERNSINQLNDVVINAHSAQTSSVITVIPSFMKPSTIAPAVKCLPPLPLNFSFIYYPILINYCTTIININDFPRLLCLC